MENSRPIALMIFLVCGACAPNPKQFERGALEPKTPIAADSPRAGINSTKTTPIDRNTCGLPAAIQKPDWPRTLAPVSSIDPVPETEESVILAVLPDTQYYASCREKHMAAQTRFVAEYGKTHRLAATLFLGDLTEHNSKEEWEYVQNALDLLPKNVPTILATGNHDYGHEGTADVRSTLFNELLDQPSQATQAAVLAQMEPGHWENVAYRITTPVFSFSVLVLEWSPRTSAVNWAKKVLSSYPNERLIFITHAYMYYDDTRYDWKRRGTLQEWNPIAYGTAMKDPEGVAGGDNLHPDGAWDGQMLWDELLADYPGLFLTLSGHVLGDGTGLLSSRGSAGNLVHQVLTNFQMLDEGGLGYLRLIELPADGSKMVMKTYSPSLSAYATSPDQLFTLTLEPPLN